MQNLNDTISYMQSDDYKDRFIAEYFQVKIRYERLKEMLIKWDNNMLSFKPTCPRSIYTLQLDAMEKYLAILEARAMIEDVDLS